MNEETQDAPASPPESVGPYRIAGRLGAGGMGEVYRARDERLERWVAIKHIRPGESDNRSRERLRREARAVASLNHPSIVQVHDIVESDDGDWVVMELVEGRTLQALIDEHGLEISQVVELGREIVEGLAEAHTKGIIHRDLKTENVMVTPSGHAKILDFGLAKRLWHGRNEASLSVQGSILGTGRAMSPEQVLGEEIDHRSDLFSFGTLLFETVTGRRPFVGSSLIITLAQVCTEEQPSARTLNPSVPTELSALIDRLLQKDPLQRPQSASEVVEELRRISVRTDPGSLAGPTQEPTDTAEVPSFENPPTSPIPQDPGAGATSWIGTSGVSASAAVQGRAAALAQAMSSQTALNGGSGVVRATESTAGVFIKTLVRIDLLATEQIGDRYEDARSYEILARHDRMARDLLAELEGLEIHKNEGFLCLFERPVDAVEFALTYHRCLAEFSTEVGVELEARAGVHLSEVFLRENLPEDIHRGAKAVELEGMATLVVERVMQLGQGGQTLLTQEAYDMARRALLGHRLAEQDLFWTTHGRYLLNGLDESVRLFEVSTQPVAPRSPEASDAQRLDDSEEGSLKRPFTLPRPALALAALALLMVIGYLLVEPLRRGGLIPHSGAGALTSATGEKNPRPAIAVLNFRDLSGASEESWLSTALSELLSSELAVTEDVRLIAGETISRLDIELRSDTLAPDTLEQIYSKIGADYVIVGSYLVVDDDQLRVQMALQATRGGGTLTSVSENGTRSGLLEIVARAGHAVRQKLDLSTEPRADVPVTAAKHSRDERANRLYFVGVEKLRNFDVLGARDAFEQAIEIDPDFALAHADLGHAWRLLGYDAEAAESSRRAWQLVRDRADVLPRKDLLQIEVAYHETAGDYAAAIRSLEELWGSFPDEIDAGLRLAEVQVEANRDTEALQTVSRLRQLPRPLRDDPRIDLAEATAASNLRQHTRTLEAGQRAIEKGREQGLETLVAEALRLRGLALRFLRQPEAARDELEDARDLFVDAGDLLGEAKVLYTLATVAQFDRDFSYAERLTRDALDIFLKTGSRRHIATIKNSLAWSIEGKGQLTEARDMLEEALAVNLEIGNQGQEIDSRDTLIWVLYQLGELGRAARLGEEQVEICRERGSFLNEMVALYSLGHIALAVGELDEAQEKFERSLEMARARDRQEQAALALSGLGAVSLARDELEAATARFREYRDIQRNLGEWGEQAIVEPLYATALYESGQTVEAEAMALEVARRFERFERPEYAGLALAVGAWIQEREGLYEDARSTLSRALELGGTSEAPAIRLYIRALEAFFLATHDRAEASRRLRALEGEANQDRLVALELEIRLLQGRLRLSAVADEHRDAGRSLLTGLVEQARAEGYELIARRAAELLDGSRPP